ncbi:hypothetical protein AK812_SmicGene39295 [Symbiodinium microadriaticum]|uniref:Uncharacterized protein n=1 Tax=Symbiodinium microadriaticum TaxID=2951 RepID=A0A1Q9CBV8_SYMMI|nr:hypothetical protein AK812_SmicGene39295 [Symbiodinium microadriaticum]
MALQHNSKAAAEPFEQAMGHAMEQVVGEVVAVTQSIFAKQDVYKLKKLGLEFRAAAVANKYTMASSVLTSVSKGLKAMRSHGQDLISYAKELKTESEHLSKEARVQLKEAKQNKELNKKRDPALAYLPTA